MVFFGIYSEGQINTIEYEPVGSDGEKEYDVHFNDFTVNNNTFVAKNFRGFDGLLVNFNK